MLKKATKKITLSSEQQVNVYRWTLYEIISPTRLKMLRTSEVLARSELWAKTIASIDSQIYWEGQKWSGTSITCSGLSTTGDQNDNT